MMHTVQPNIHVVKVVPLLLRDQVTHHFPVLAAHGENLPLEPGLVIGAKTSHVGGIVADQVNDFFFDLGRMRELVGIGVGREKTSHAYSIDFARRVTWWNTDDNRGLPFLSQIIPDGWRLDAARISDS